MADNLKYSVDIDTAPAQSHIKQLQQSLAGLFSQQAGGTASSVQLPDIGKLNAHNAELEKARQGLDNFGKSGQSLIPGLNGINGGVSKLASNFSALGLAIAAGQMARFAKDTVDAAIKAESAFKGLESQANGTGIGITKAWGAAQQLTADGVLTQTEAATALKNLFARGFGLEESIRLINAFKDSAAFGRQSTLQWGEAVVTATEGLKNENSMLVDNAGVTKNVAKMWEDFARAHNKTAEALTMSEKRMAELDGVMAESRNSLGDTKKALDGTQGSTVAFNKAWLDLKTNIGSKIEPFWADMAKSGSSFITDVLNPMVERLEKAANIAKMVVGAGAVYGVSGALNGKTKGREDADAYVRNAQEEGDNIWRRQNGMYEKLTTQQTAAENKKALRNAQERQDARVNELKGLADGIYADYSKSTQPSAGNMSVRPGASLPPLLPNLSAIPPMPAGMGLPGLELPPLLPAALSKTKLPPNFALPPTNPNDGVPAGSQRPFSAIPVFGPTAATYNVRDNIDPTRVALNQSEKDKADYLKTQNATYDQSLKALERAKQEQDSELQIFKAGLEAKRGALEEFVQKNPDKKQNFAIDQSKLDMELLDKEQEQRVKRLTAMELQVLIARRTADPEKVKDAETALDKEVASKLAAEEQKKALESKARRESLDGLKEDEKTRQEILEKGTKAQIEAEKSAEHAINENQLKELSNLKDQKLVEEEDYQNKYFAIKDGELKHDIERAAQLRALNAKKYVGFDPVAAAEKQAEDLKLATEEKTLNEERKKLALEKDNAIKLSAFQVAQLQLDLNQQIAEAEGRTFEARTQAIDKWLTEKRRELQAYPEMLAKAETVGVNQKKTVAFDQAKQGVTDTNFDYEQNQKALGRLKDRGKIGDLEYDQRALEMTRAQSAALKERLSVLKENANKSPEQIQQVKDLEAAILEMDSKVSDVAKSLDDNFFSVIENGFKDMLSGAKTPLEALKSMVANVLQEIANMALKAGLQKMLGSALTGGGEGGIGSAITSLFGGFRAAGGDVDSGKAYIVGEKGPELHFPGANGRIVSNADIQRALASPAIAYMPTSARLPSDASLAGAGAAGSTNVNVPIQVHVSARDTWAAMMQLPEVEGHVVNVINRNRNRLKI